MLESKLTASVLWREKQSMHLGGGVIKEEFFDAQIHTASLPSLAQASLGEHWAEPGSGLRLGV